MRAEALEDYTAAVHDYAFTGTLSPQALIRIALLAVLGAAANMLKRSSVMWSIRALAIELMRTRFFHPLVFTVKYEDGDLYGGVLFEPSGVVMPAEADSPDVALAPSSENVTSMFCRKTKPLADQTHHQVDFRFVGERLSQYHIFSALLTAL